MNELPEIPEPDAFRAWVEAALVVLEQRPARVAVAIGASVNSVGAFLRESDRDITLSRAAAIERHLREVASELGVPLPRIGGGGDE